LKLLSLFSFAIVTDVTIYKFDKTFITRINNKIDADRVAE